MIILAYKYGQLGNRLAYLKEYIALAIEYDVMVIIFSFDEYGSYFSGTSQGLLCTYPVHKGLSLGKRLISRCMYVFLRCVGGLFNLFGNAPTSIFPKPDENGCHIFVGKRIDSLISNWMELYLSGWPCVPIEIIEKHSDKIREYFSLVNEQAVIVKVIIARARTYGDYLVGIHIRQGDYKEWNGGKCYFKTDVYVRLMRKILEKHRDRKVVFFVCSNEQQNWSLFEEFTFVTGPGDAVIEMYSLAECDEIYGPQSSFSAWASFYGRTPLYGVEPTDNM